MYSHCISCSRNLGQNAALEHLPVGRQIAFDAHKGRLWVICRKCRNWNLVPLDERWEAVEEAEIRFESLDIEAATENVALAACGDGSELIRIGGATLPEIALWRYARKVMGRYRTNMVAGGAVAAGAAAVSFLTGFGYSFVALAALGVFAGGLTIHDMKPALRTSGDRTIRSGAAKWIQLHPSDNLYGWALHVPMLGRRIELEGIDALRALRRLLPRTNMFGAEPEDTQTAAKEVARRGASDQFIQSVASRLGQEWYISPNHTPLALGTWGRALPHRIATGIPALRLSLEMAVNELCERRFLEGEMVELEREWREAEELAAISDRLLVPGAREWLRNRNPMLPESLPEGIGRRADG